MMWSRFELMSYLKENFALTTTADIQPDANC